MAAPPARYQSRKTPDSNHPSSLLSDQENETVYEILGKRCVVSKLFYFSVLSIIFFGVNFKEELVPRYSEKKCG